jgi:predicted AlkP superfamily phosphohydrolase/phosphomutase
MHQLVVIGLDGAPFGLIRKWAEEGILPNLQKLIEKGAFGPLLSSEIPETPIAWSSIVTGKNAGKHGVYDWADRIDGSYELGVALSTSCKEPALWDILGKAGKKTGVFNVPITYPPREVNGYLVSGFDAPSVKSTFTYPPALSEEIRSNVDDYVLSVQESYTRGKEEDYVKGLMYSLEKKEDAALYLLDRYPTDLVFHVFMELDHVHHKLWRLVEKGTEKEVRLFQKVYQRMDETVGKLINRFGEETTFLLISDHGAGPLEGVMFINKWLMDQGWLRLKRGPALRLKSFLSRTDLVPKVYRVMSKLGLGYLGKLLPPSLQHNLATSFISFKDVDWEKTKAFAYGEYGQIFINLKGREPRGIVAPGEEYDRLLDEISQRLLLLVHPKTGEKTVNKIFRKEELYHGPMAGKAPDLTFAIGDFRYDSSVKFGIETRDVFGPPEFEDSGTHRREGILIACGKQIKKGCSIHGATLFDVAPTVLYLLNCPVPPDMDGRPLTSMVQDDWIERNPVQYGGEKTENVPSAAEKTHSPEELELVKKRLRGLGYLD